MGERGRVRTRQDTARPFVSVVRETLLPKSIVVAFPDAGIRTMLMGALRQDGWETVGAHSGTEVVRWLSVAELAQRPLPELLVLCSGLRVHGVPIARAIAPSVRTSSILYLDDGDNDAMADHAGAVKATAARWPLDLDDFRTMVQLLLECSPRTRALESPRPAMVSGW